MQQASMAFCRPRMLTSRPIQGSRSMVIDMSAARWSTPSMPSAASISCGSRITSPCTSLSRASPCRCLTLSAEPWKKLSRIFTSAAPSSSMTSAVAEPTRLAPPMIRKRLPLIGSEWDFAARGDVALMWEPRWGLVADRPLETMNRPTRHRKFRRDVIRGLVPGIQRAECARLCRMAPTCAAWSTLQDGSRA